MLTDSICRKLVVNFLLLAFSFSGSLWTLNSPLVTTALLFIRLIGTSMLFQTASHYFKQLAAALSQRCHIMRKMDFVREKAPFSFDMAEA